MYDAISDRYCYPDTTVLINRLDLREQAALDAFEAEISRERAAEPLPEGQLDVVHYKAIHHHLFQDVYDWAGAVRNVRIAKDGSMFCYPEHIDNEMAKLFARLREEAYFRGQNAATFARNSAAFISDLNAIHAFREGNGRAQLAFLGLLADLAGHPIAFERLEPATFLNSMIDSFGGNNRPLIRMIEPDDRAANQRP
jgi:cell filamentation protein